MGAPGPQECTIGTSEPAARKSDAPSITEGDGDSPLLTTASDIGLPMPGSLRYRYNEDPFFRKLMRDPEQFADFQEIDGLVYKTREGKRVLCIPDITIGDRRAREIVITHAHSLLAHLGHRKTIDLLREEVWW
ncbi:hypothetical protein K525DRAFT_213465, partial [Schizophyllum commune Loenen D]